MRTLFSLFLIFLCPTVAFSQDPSGLIPGSIPHDGIARSYWVYVSKRYHRDDHPALVLALHGGGGTGKNFYVDGGSLRRAADERNMVLVFPDGLNRSWNDGRPEIFKRKEQPPDDVGFMSVLIDKIAKDYGIDPAKVFATGISNGGHMTIRLALELSAKIKAAAPVAALLPRAHEGRYPEQPVSLLLIEGSEDPLVPYDGGHVRVVRFGRSRGEVLSARDTIGYFARHYACAGSPTVEPIRDQDPGDGTKASLLSYPDCRDGVRLELIKVTGGGHTWPGGAQYMNEQWVGRVSRDFDASETIMKFFMNKSGDQYQ